MRIHVGTSGYNYPEWRGTFYPSELPARRMFEYYAARFDAVEINYTFYRMPAAKTTAAWRAQAPTGFQYALKAPRQITHVLRLRDAGEAVRTFCEYGRELGPHLGPLLFQLPPTFRCDAARLEAVLASVPAGIRPTFEFRHDSWLNDEVYGVLSRHGGALCIADFGDRTTPILPTARHGYVRLRDGGYQRADLERWAAVIDEHAGDWDEVFVFFKHEEDGKGPAFARAFLDALEARR